MVNESTEAAPPARYAVVTLAGAVCVFFSGAGVLIYEFLAVRILQRFWGGAMDVWASEIAVCMAGLALGYAMGGALADRYPSWANVGIALLLAGATACVTEPIAAGVSNWLLDAEEFSTWHPLLAAGACSFMPLVALGTVSPQVIRLTAHSLERLGSTAGFIFSISTVGSIGGVLAIVPMLQSWSVLQVLYACSGTLAAGGLALIIFGRGRRGLIAAAGIAAILALPQPTGAQEVLYERYSAHHHIIVEDVGDVRKLRFDNAVQSLMSLSDPQRGGFGYTDFFHLPMIFNPKMERVLFMGLGGATGPKAYLEDYPAVSVDVAEIDPQVERIAKEYFHMPANPGLNIEIQDGRVFIQRTKESYGAIIIDAYGSGARGAYLPYHLATREFFKLVRDRLEDGGVVVYNAVGRQREMNHEVISGLYATLSDQFEAVYVYEETSSINTVFVAVKLEKDPQVTAAAWPEGPFLSHPVTKERIERMAQQLAEAKKFKRSDLTKKFGDFAPMQFEQPTAAVLTDNRAPVDISGRRR